MKHYVKIFSGSLCTLEEEVNEYTSQIVFQGSTARIQAIQSVPQGHGVAIIIHYISSYEIR